MDVAAGMGVCGWNIQHTNVNMGRRGGLSSSLDDCLLGKADQVKKDHWLQMDKLIKEIFPCLILITKFMIFCWRQSFDFGMPT